MFSFGLFKEFVFHLCHYYHSPTETISSDWFWNQGFPSPRLVATSRQKKLWQPYNLTHSWEGKRCIHTIPKGIFCEIECNDLNRKSNSVHRFLFPRWWNKWKFSPFFFFCLFYFLTKSKMLKTFPKKIKKTKHSILYCFTNINII